MCFTGISASAANDVNVGTVTVKSDYTCTADAVRVNWNRTSGATGYKVFRSKSGTDKWEVVGRIYNANTTTYRDAGLAPATSYTYKVQAFNENFSTGKFTYGAASREFKASTNPAAVTIKTAYTNAGDAVRINWNKAAGAGGYRVYRYTSSGWKALATLDANTFTYRDSGLARGTVYKYVVRSYKRINGELKFSAYSKTKRAATLCSPVTVKSTNRASDAARVTWGKVNCTGYEVFQLKSGKWTKIATVKGSATTTYRIAGLKPSTKYQFKIRAYVSDGAGKVFYSSCASAAVTTSGASTPVAQNGKLRVSGGNIVNSRGERFQLKGMSTHGIMWEDYSNILSKASLKVLRDDWKANTIRIAMYTEEWGGYTTGATYASQAKQKVFTGVQNATDLGMYVIIDWHVLHDENPQKHQTEAVQFFTEMAKKYKNNTNVIYEICNEPNGNYTWASNIKPYCQAVVSAIRKYDPDAIIVCGTGTWSQDIQDVVGNRLSDKNCVYALHFYANTHTDWLRNRLIDCYNKGLPVLVTEFGTCDASGNGGFNDYQTRAWIDLLNSKKIGFMNWSASSKSETASAFKPGTNLAAISAGTSQLTESGKLVRELMRNS